MYVRCVQKIQTAVYYQNHIHEIMDKKELDYEINATKRVLAELRLSGDAGAVKLAQEDLEYLFCLKWK